MFINYRGALFKTNIFINIFKAYKKCANNRKVTQYYLQSHIKPLMKGSR